MLSELPPAPTPPMPRQPLVSVVICTRNRSGPLARLLGSMVQLSVPPGLVWELVLIDNGSTDDTRAVAERSMPDLPIRYVAHDEAGVANARNRALDEARGTYICWTDDDTRVERLWLTSYVDAFARHPEAAIFGGPITPTIVGATPPWLLLRQHVWPLNSIVGYIDCGTEVVRMGPKPFGGNWAVRVAEARAARFDAALGWGPSQARVAEETDLIDRLLRGGATGWWVPDARLHHFVSSDRLGWAKIYRHHAAKGDTDAYIHNRSPDANWLLDRQARVLRIGRRGLKIRAAWHGFQYALWRLLLRKPQALRSLARLAYCNGFANHRRMDSPQAPPPGVAGHLNAPSATAPALSAPPPIGRRSSNGQASAVPDPTASNAGHLCDQAP